MGGWFLVEMEECLESFLFFGFCFLRINVLEVFIFWRECCFREKKEGGMCIFFFVEVVFF